eukprot:2778264-Amphidinium_carterae.2
MLSSLFIFYSFFECARCFKASVDRRFLLSEKFLNETSTTAWYCCGSLINRISPDGQAAYNNAIVPRLFPPQREQSWRKGFTSLQLKEDGLVNAELQAYFGKTFFPSCDNRLSGMLRHIEDRIVNVCQSKVVKVHLYGLASKRGFKVTHGMFHHNGEG